MEHCSEKAERQPPLGLEVHEPSGPVGGGGACVQYAIATVVSFKIKLDSGSGCNY